MGDIETESKTGSFGIVTTTLEQAVLARLVSTSRALVPWSFADLLARLI
jgi:hypothetical protein